MTRTGLVLVASTRAARGEYTDRSGPVLVDFLRSHGLDTPDARVVSDAGITAAVEQALAEGPSVLLTSGGTGVSPDDRTVEALSPLLERQLPGLVHAFYDRGVESVPTAVLSRTVAGVAGRTFAMALPGSTGAAKDAVAVLGPVLDHLLAQLEGHRDH
ncbi:MogA/MoaB family molybdenum cofactor biosynthesis protein [Corynebacterium sp. YIM 101645]|uniref:MogA/MoaB family molybdenum cofactor biosynthesis protein n=1 Tax=Corynebacterium lemuris TaxID=1859292 RepID=A0ABT2FW93_9CORY|nr:MogA/MoaB family molybdenum cofactor biosynthesis protein [Corynebacterium lemuris]MCS5478234.1 MogA/MoaB family molybdenum cofactor biosynthesis protein [Corynebacterium lemuris]